MIEPDRLVGRPFKPGQSGNPYGRPIGARNKLAENFIADTAAAWQKHGPRVLETMALTEPSRFAELCGKLVPREMQLSLTASLPGNLDAGDWSLLLEIVAAVKAAIPDASTRPPQAVLEYCREALAAHSAKPLIEAPADMETAGTDPADKQICE
jgi:hypothetical protein